MKIVPMILIIIEMTTKILYGWVAAVLKLENDNPNAYPYLKNWNFSVQKIVV